MDRMGKETNWVFQANDVRKLSSHGVKFRNCPPTNAGEPCKQYLRIYTGTSSS
jgi:hypothetical protein